MQGKHKCRTRTIVRMVAGAALIAGIGAAVPGHAAASTPAGKSALSASTACTTGPAAGSATAVPDTRLDTFFDDYANDHTSNDDWTGADSTYSAPLPGGHDAFIFSDSFLGTVNADGSRSTATPFVNNSIIETGPGGPRTVIGGTASAPDALVPEPDANHWYWARDGIYLGGRLQVVYSEFQRTGTGALDFAWYRNVLATFASGTQLGAPVSVVPLPSSANISWGAWLTRQDGYTYVYGAEDLGIVKYAHLARVRGDNLAGTWQYYTANGTWSSTETDSARLSTSAGASLLVSNEFSVVKHGSVYVLVTQDLSELFSPEIDVAYACSPTGPFTTPTTVYTTPETGALGTYQDSNVWTYNPHEHPELDRDGDLVISYNVNSFDNNELYTDASIYRPRFIDVRLPGLK